MAEKIQVGVMGFRSPTGEFLEATPIYKLATPELKAAEAAMIADLAAIFAEAMHTHIESGREMPKAGPKQRKSRKKEQT